LQLAETFLKEYIMDEKKAILVIGAGDATGGAIARRFAREGYIACV
jgi:NAD(P)-dependent dehydrogenase (short-subunit alcohol dehydrogenase family)